MCIRDRLSLPWAIAPARAEEKALYLKQAAVSVGATESYLTCLLYTSDAADDDLV